MNFNIDRKILVSVNNEAKNTNSKQRNQWSFNLKNAVFHLNNMPDGVFASLMLKGRQNTSNRRGGELSDFALNNSNLVRVAFGMKQTTVYDWGRINQARSRKKMRNTKR